MAHARVVKVAAGLVTLLVIAVVTIAAQNSAPNPYREDANWAKLPATAGPLEIEKCLRSVRVSLSLNYLW